MNIKQIIGLASVVFAAAAWINYVERPTNRNLKRAVIRTLSL